MDIEDNNSSSSFLDEEPIAVKLRIPSILIPTYKALMNTREGKLAMKRIKVGCGICKETKSYSIHRGVTRVATIIACENCRHFYQIVRRKQISLDCTAVTKMSCYLEGTFLTTRCKACWAMQILDYCPHPEDIYQEIYDLLSEDCKKGVRGFPIDLEDVKEEGTLALEVMENGRWIEADKSLSNQFKEIHLENATQEMENKDKPVEEPPRRSIARKSTAKKSRPIEPTQPLGMPVEEDDPDDPDSLVDLLNEPPATKTTRGSSINAASISEQQFDDVEVEEEEQQHDSLDEDGKGSLGERVSLRRKQKKIQYFTKPNSGSGPKKPPKGLIHGPDGAILANGKDLCDCLQDACVGCHFPCPKCRSPKCGNDCRVNRKFFYERVEVEGTNIIRYNKFAPKM